METLTSPPADLSETTSRSRTVVRRCSDAPPENWDTYCANAGYAGFHLCSQWMNAIQDGLQHKLYYLFAEEDGKIVGVLPVAYVRSWLFGRFLASSPYLNTGGVLADTDEVATRLIDAAVELSEELDVRQLELRHEAPRKHMAFNAENSIKVHMRMPLPGTTTELWDGLKSKRRSQIKKPLGNEHITVAWGQEELLDDFYYVFCGNMRDLGTPPYSKKLFARILQEFNGNAELCCLYYRGKPAAAAILVHGPGVTQVPSASTLRKYNSLAINMRMYWHLVSRAVERGQHTFDFGRSSQDSGTFKFKQQWGAVASPACWQLLVRQGDSDQLRPESGKFSLLVRIWKKLPVWLTRLIGPQIVRGIP